MDAINATHRKFGHPATVIRDYAHWTVQLRPEQVTLGSLVLVCKDPARSFAAITPPAFAELGTVTADAERVLKDAWGWSKINYLMLMMTDPDVHFHVFPRYDRTLSFAGLAFPDRGWPRQPDMANPVRPEPAVLEAIAGHLRERWPR